MTNELLLDIILIILNVFSFSIGLILGRMWFGSSVYQNMEKPKPVLQKTNALNKDKVIIDDKKIVLNIKTDGMEKKYENLGEIKQSSEKISSSVDKLKNIKKG